MEDYFTALKFVTPLFILGCLIIMVSAMSTVSNFEREGYPECSKVLDVEVTQSRGIFSTTVLKYTYILEDGSIRTLDKSKYKIGECI